MYWTQKIKMLKSNVKSIKNKLDSWRILKNQNILPYKNKTIETFRNQNLGFKPYVKVFKDLFCCQRAEWGEKDKIMKNSTGKKITFC